MIVASVFFIDESIVFVVDDVVIVVPIYQYKGSNLQFDSIHPASQA